MTPSRLAPLCPKCNRPLHLSEWVDECVEYDCVWGEEGPTPSGAPRVVESSQGARYDCEWCDYSAKVVEDTTPRIDFPGGGEITFWRPA